jgi:DNA-binding NtrC family response regulator
VNAPNESSSGKSLTLLVVDDEAMIRMIARAVLGGAGHSVEEADSIASAVAALEAAPVPFDLILLDLTLPDGDSSRAIPDFRDRAPGTRILVVSGMGAVNPADIGADDFLAKPFTRATLFNAVERTLGRNGQGTDRRS